MLVGFIVIAKVIMIIGGLMRLWFGSMVVLRKRYTTITRQELVAIVVCGITPCYLNILRESRKLSRVFG